MLSSRLSDTVRERDTLAMSYVISQEDVKRVKRVGSGAFGDVFLATWFGQRVAVKESRLGAAAVMDMDSDSFRQEMMRERHTVHSPTHMCTEKTSEVGLSTSMHMRHTTERIVNVSMRMSMGTGTG